MNEEALVRRSCEGDQDAFRALVEKYQTKVFQLAYAITRNQTEADDLTQDVFLKAFSGLKNFKFRSEFGTWLYRIAVNHIHDHLRRERRTKKLQQSAIHESSMVQEDAILLKERQQEHQRMKTVIHRAIAELPEKQRIIISLRDIQGLSYSQIAEILKIAPGTVDSRLFRARSLLRRKVSSLTIQKGESHEVQKS